MAVTTFENFYTLVKNNIVYFQYQKNDIVLNIKGTLVRDLIPGSDNDLLKYEASTLLSDYHLGLWVGLESNSIADSAEPLQRTQDENYILNMIKNSNSSAAIPEWLKIYSTNYGKWFNIEISKILSLQVVDS